MNYQICKTKSPTAFKAFMFPLCPKELQDIYDQCNFFHNEKKQIFFGNQTMNIMIVAPYHRILYDFFDMNNIYITCGPLEAVIWLIGKDSELLSEERIEKKGRKFNEFAAMQRAFEILEEVIQQQSVDNSK